MDTEIWTLYNFHTSQKIILLLIFPQQLKIITAILSLQAIEKEETDWIWHSGLVRFSKWQFLVVGKIPSASPTTHGWGQIFCVHFNQNNVLRETAYRSKYQDPAAFY